MHVEKLKWMTIMNFVRHCDIFVKSEKLLDTVQKNLKNSIERQV
jgi:hypothetical protein